MVQFCSMIFVTFRYFSSPPLMLMRFGQLSQKQVFRGFNLTALLRSLVMRPGVISPNLLVLQKRG